MFFFINGRFYKALLHVEKENEKVQMALTGAKKVNVRSFMEEFYDSCKFDELFL